MNLGDIARAFTKTLHDNFPGHAVYSMARTESIKRPAFFFYLKPVISEPANKVTRHNILSLYVDYFQKVKDEAGMYDTASKIRDILGFAYQVGDRYIDVTEFDWEFVGSERNVLELNITLEYFDLVGKEETADLMEEASVKVTLKEELGNETT